jgi:Ser-tRNA(Ala) deacylase AlaX
VVSGRRGDHHRIYRGDIKYVVFDESDKDKMSKEEFDKAMQVNKEQEELRTEVLKREREKKAQNRKAS